MSTETTLIVVGGGILLFVLVVAWLVRARRRERQLVEILDLPYGERDVSIEAATERGLVAGTVHFAGKTQVTGMVTRLLGLDAPPKPADAADALALAICHIWRGGTRARIQAAAVAAARKGGSRR